MAEFAYLNINPDNNETEDCVCRAISLAMDIPYEEIEYKLKVIADLFDCDELCVCCYRHLLEQVFGLEPKFANGETVDDIADFYDGTIVIMRLDGHLTVSLYGTVYDLWDCRDEYVDVYWIV